MWKSSRSLGTPWRPSSGLRTAPLNVSNQRSASPIQNYPPARKNCPISVFLKKSRQIEDLRAYTWQEKFQPERVRRGRVALPTGIVEEPRKCQKNVNSAIHWQKIEKIITQERRRLSLSPQETQLEGRNLRGGILAQGEVKIDSTPCCKGSGWAGKDGRRGRGLRSSRARRELASIVVDLRGRCERRVLWGYSIWKEVEKQRQEEELKSERKSRWTEETRKTKEKVPEALQPRGKSGASQSTRSPSPIAPQEEDHP